MDASSSSSSATMSTQENLPTLALSDIMHHLSPSPVDASSNIIGRPNSPLPVSSLDVMTMRDRLKELQNAAMMGPDVTGLREAELLQMVSRLTETLPIDPAQLEAQANIIGQLMLQRDLVVREAEQERARWQAERESWDRTAEALILQRTRVSKLDEIERQRGLWEAENHLLRDKLKDAETKLAAIEAEVTRLRPLLLMQPYSISRLKQNFGISSRDKGKKRDVEPPRTALGGDDASDSKSSTQPDSVPSSFHYNLQNTPSSTFPAPPSITITSPNSSIPPVPGPPPKPPAQLHMHSRRSHHGKTHSKSSKYAKSASLTSDALTAHLLLAAQRIGRQRTSIVTGLMRKAEQEKEEQVKAQEQLRLQAEQAEKEKMERLANNTGRVGYYRSGADSLFNSPQRGLTASQTLPAMPRTPKRNGHHPHTGQSGGSVSTPAQYVFINASASTTPSGNPAPPEISRTPSSIPSQKVLPSTNPPTPLDSLLDAARSMMDSPGRRKAADHPESPSPKRRRVSGAAASKANGKLTRVRSALEVLAEEAAAASGSGSQGASYDAPDEGHGNRTGLLDTHLSGKGKGRATGTSKDRERSLSRTNTASTNLSNPHRQSSRRRGSLQNADASSVAQSAQPLPPTRTSDRLSNKESLPPRIARSRKSISKSNTQDGAISSQSNVPTRGASTSSGARVIAPADEYFSATSGRSMLQGRTTYTSSSSGPGLIGAQSIRDDESATLVHSDVDVDSENRDAMERDAGLQEAQNSRAYSTAETRGNRSLSQGRKLQHLVNNTTQPRIDTTTVVEASGDSQVGRPITDRDILTPETHSQPLNVLTADSRARVVDRGENDMVGVDADRDEIDDDDDVGSDVDMLADDDDEYDGRTMRGTVNVPSPRTSRSRSPLPAQDLHPKTRNESGHPGAEDDQDADAEGEMDLGDGEGQHPGPGASS
ncbi:hypothetical protein BJ165DRAFT_637277 [Panaeolus papilionaceus]|nr:hypothetical protein BJ165DRAFT_637277 [Panaeolus papilionaceus]